MHWRSDARGEEVQRHPAVRESGRQVGLVRRQQHVRVVERDDVGFPANRVSAGRRRRRESRYVNDRLLFAVVLRQQDVVARAARAEVALEQLGDVVLGVVVVPLGRHRNDPIGARRRARIQHEFVVDVVVHEHRADCIDGVARSGPVGRDDFGVVEHHGSLRVDLRQVRRGKACRRPKRRGREAGQGNRVFACVATADRVDQRYAAEQAAVAWNQVGRLGYWRQSGASRRFSGRRRLHVRDRLQRRARQIAHFDDFDVAFLGPIQTRAGCILRELDVSEGLAGSGDGRRRT